MMRKLGLKPQDVYILLYLLLVHKGPWKYAELAQELNISTSEVHEAIKRAVACDLFDPLTKRPKRVPLNNFIIHGIRHVFPAVVGDRCKGIPTAHSAEPLSNLIASEIQDNFVWPNEQGSLEGYKVDPLYPSIPQVSPKHPPLHQMLSLIDALRVGKAREREIAQKEIQERIATA